MHAVSLLSGMITSFTAWARAAWAAATPAQLELAQQVVVARAAALALVDLDEDARLVVRVGAEGLHGQEGVSQLSAYIFDRPRHSSTSRAWMSTPSWCLHQLNRL